MYSLLVFASGPPQGLYTSNLAVAKKVLNELKPGYAHCKDRIDLQILLLLAISKLSFLRRLHALQDGD